MSHDLQNTVIAACTKHKQQNSQNNSYRACVHIGTEYFVKYGSRRDLEPELATQEYIFAYAQQSKTLDAPRIAKIVHQFVDQRTMYLVMERIELRDSTPDLAARIAIAMKWLSEVPIPANSTLGPVGGGRISHKFFKDFKAPFGSLDVKELDQYMKTVYGLLSDKGRRVVSPVSVSGERLMFTQSDMDDSNFGVDERGRTVLMDFSEIGVLPETFVAYTLSSDERLLPIAASLGLSGNSNLASMAAIAHCLVMVSDPKLGMATELSKTRRRR